MNTLITPLQAVKTAFSTSDCMPPDTFTEADLTAAERRYILPCIGASLYEKLLAGDYSAFRSAYLATPVALFARVMIQPRINVRTSVVGTVAPKSDRTQPAANEPLREQLSALRREARELLQRASDYLADHAADFPEYDTAADVLNRCRIHGNLVQIF